MIPPRQPHGPVRRIALPVLVLISTGVIVSVLVLFFRGTKPRHATSPYAAPARMVVADGWVSGLPDHPLPAEPPPKPPPPIDADARRELLALRQAMQQRDEQTTKSLEEIRKLLAQRQTPPPAKAPEPPKPDPLAEMRKKAMASALQVVEVKAPAEDHGPHDGMVLLPVGTYIPIALETAIHSDREGHVVARVTTRILDAHGREVIPQQALLVGAYRSSTLLYGDERLDLWFSSLNLGEGVSLPLDDEKVGDSIGQAGVTGDVDQHYGRLLGAVFINGVLRGGAMAVQQEVAGVGGAGPIASGIAGNAAAVGQQRTSRTMNTSPTIRVPIGYRMTLILGNDLWVTPLRS
jgi:type IV secretory pathway VirB10-like protein